MTPDQQRAIALQAAVAFAAANNNNPTLGQVADAYNYFRNLIDVGLLRNLVSNVPVQLPFVLPPRPVADRSKYTAKVNGG